MAATRRIALQRHGWGSRCVRAPKHSTSLRHSLPPLLPSSSPPTVSPPTTHVPTVVSPHHAAGNAPAPCSRNHPHALVESASSKPSPVTTLYWAPGGPQPPPRDPASLHPQVVTPAAANCPASLSAPSPCWAQPAPCPGFPRQANSQLSGAQPRAGLMRAPHPTPVAVLRPPGKPARCHKPRCLASTCDTRPPQTAPQCS